MRITNEALVYALRETLGDPSALSPTYQKEAANRIEEQAETIKSLEDKLRSWYDDFGPRE